MDTPHAAQGDTEAQTTGMGVACEELGRPSCESHPAIHPEANFASWPAWAAVCWPVRSGPGAQEIEEDPAEVDRQDVAADLEAQHGADTTQLEAVYAALEEQALDLVPVAGDRSRSTVPSGGDAAASPPPPPMPMGLVLPTCFL